MAQWGTVFSEMQAAGVLLHGMGLDEESTATTLRITDGERVLTDGPFAETKELLFSFFIIDVRRPRRGDRVGGQDAERDLRVGRGPAAVAARAVGAVGRPGGPGRSLGDRLGARSRVVRSLAHSPPSWSAPTATSGPRSWRRVTRQVGGDIGLAEDAVQDAFTAAAADWPRRGRARPARRLVDGDGAAAGHRPRPARPGPQAAHQAGARAPRATTRERRPIDEHATPGTTAARSPTTGCG